MIFGFIGRIVGGVIKKIITLILLVVAIVWSFFNWDTVQGWMAKANQLFNNDYGIHIKTNDGNFDYTVNFKKSVDAWLVANKLNEYGDPQGTLYAGGTPLFNEQTGEYTDRYEYLLEKYPELKNLPK